MTLVQNGGLNPATADYGDTVPYTYRALSLSNSGGQSNQWYHNARIQDYSSFTFSMDIAINNQSGDGFYFFCGANSINNASGTNMSNYGNSTGNNAYFVDFHIYTGNGNYRSGIYLLDNNSTGAASSKIGQVAFSPFTDWRADNNYHKITITYTKGSVNTWVVNVNGVDALTYSDPNNTAWLSSSGSYWGIGQMTGAATFSMYLRSLELSYIPSTQISASSIAPRNFSFSSLRNKTAPGLMPGMTSKVYDGYANGDITWGDTYAYRHITRTVNTSNLLNLSNGYVINSSSINTFTVQSEGWFLANATGTWTFAFTSIDDFAKLYINGTLLISTVTSGTISMTSGTYYKINIYYGNNSGPGEVSLTFTPPGGSATSDWTGYIFSSTGTDSNYPAESAKVIKDITGTNTDGVYYINVNGTSTATYCLMNDCYDGGGWMMLMKGTRGTTFQYSANYWTSTNTLNPTDTTRVDGDAKYDAFNYMKVKDVMAIWPDIPSTSATNPQGRYGGSLFLQEGWCWKIDNWNGGSKTTPLAGFQNSRQPGGNPSNLTVTYGVNNPFHFNGFSSSLWSNQSSAYLHGVNLNGSSGAPYSGPYIRWGFLFNNSVDFASCDAFGGIGMGSGSYSTYSAGDHGNASFGTLGMNRSARFEMFGR
jgi:hypothetical protein